MSKIEMLKSVALLSLFLTGFSLPSKAHQAPVRCAVENKEPGVPDYSVRRNMQSGHEPSETYLFIYVDPKHFVRDDMLALARQLSKDFCKEQRFGVILLDDDYVARHVSVLNVRFKEARRGFYHIDRGHEEYIEFSTERGKPIDEVKINLMQDKPKGQREQIPLK